MEQLAIENGVRSDTQADRINFSQFLNVGYDVIGRTVSTKSEPNTSSRFHFWVADRDEAQGRIEIGNIVAAYSDDQDDVTFGVVTEMRSYSDVDSFIADYLSHDFGEADVQVPTDIAEVVVVTCAVMRNVSLKTKPVGRSRVYFPSPLGIQYSYGIVNEKGESIFSGAAIPVGVFENGDGTIAPISVDEDFLVGPEGAHLNVTGISGLAAKTSAVEFVLKSLLTHTGKKIAVVMFNVKSKDLLYVDRPNTRLEAGDDRAMQSLQAYNTLQVPHKPFSGAHFFAPADPREPEKTKSLRKLETTRFEWDLQMIHHDVPTLFDPLDWDDRMEGAWFIIQEGIEQGGMVTYAQMLTRLDALIRDAERQNRQWYRNVHIATWNKLRFHLRRFPRSYAGLIATAGQGQDIPWDQLANGSVYVIDIQMLNDRGQRLVFGRSMRAISDMLESEESKLDAVVVFVDELNKFAPSGSIRTPLKSRLIDVTARGRSIGLVLFGAEQFASSVEKEIIENSSTYLFGRTETNELRTPNYSAFSDEVKTKLTMLPQGQLLVKFAKFPQPIFIKFPFPPCLPGDQYYEEDF
jgi:hypothetical protein